MEDCSRKYIIPDRIFENTGLEKLPIKYMKSKIELKKQTKCPIIQHKKIENKNKNKNKILLLLLILTLIVITQQLGMKYIYHKFRLV
jgi:hypothetical protein